MTRTDNAPASLTWAQQRLLMALDGHALPAELFLSIVELDKEAIAELMRLKYVERAGNPPTVHVTDAGRKYVQRR